MHLYKDQSNGFIKKAVLKSSMAKEILSMWFLLPSQLIAIYIYDRLFNKNSSKTIFTDICSTLMKEENFRCFPSYY